jgi:hypothetical protein
MVLDKQELRNITLKLFALIKVATLGAEKKFLPSLLASQRECMSAPKVCDEICSLYEHFCVICALLKPYLLQLNIKSTSPKWILKLNKN